MHRNLPILILLAVFGCTKRNPEFCAETVECPDGLVCNFETNRCEMPPDAGMGGCTSNEQCPQITPICGSDQMCRGCMLDDECDSGVCHIADGVCEPADRVLYVAPS